MDHREKIYGCLLGGAIGDCLGVPFEGRAPGAEYIIPSNWKLSDDTQLSLATCEAISDSGAVDPEAVAARFTTWFKDSRLSGLGASTFKALTELSHGGHWALVGRKGEMAAGKGAAMRLAPIAFCLDPEDREARVRIHDLCRITHHHEEAYVGALAVVIAVRAARDGAWRGGDGLLSTVIKSLPDSSVRDRLIDISEISDKVTLSLIAAQFGCTGYVVDSIPFALCGTERLGSAGFISVLKELISAGGDTDTNASIAGQVMGTYLGQSRLPQSLVRQLPNLEQINWIIDRFVVTVANIGV